MSGCSSNLRPGASNIADRYAANVAAQPVLSLEELAEAMRHAAPATGDDVTITLDGRRIDSREGALEWPAEVEAVRAAERAAEGDA
jgi:hypothetical protein